MAKKEIAQNVLSNTFSGGLVTDSQPMLTPNTVMTDCINGTLITHNGNEYSLQNDLGNVITNGVLSPGFVPLSIKEKDGVLYILSKHSDGRVELGTYPSYTPTTYEYGEKDVTSYFINIDLNRDYTYDEVSSMIDKTTTFTISQDAFILSHEGVYDFIDTKYLWYVNDKVIELNPLIDSENINKYIENTPDSKIESIIKVIKFTPKIYSQYLYKTDSTINGYVIVEVDSKKLTNSKLDINVEIEGKLFHSEMIFDDEHEKYISKVDISLDLQDQDLHLNVYPTLTYNDNNIITYPSIYDVIEKNQILDNILDACVNWYYYRITNDDISIYFDIVDTENKVGDIVKFNILTIDDVETETFGQIISGNAKRLRDNLFNCSINFNDIFIRDNIYLFEIICDNISWKQLLITSDAFNNFYNKNVVSLKYNDISADQWLPNVMFPTIDVSYTLGDDYSTSIQTNNTTLNHRKYILRSDDKHQEFIAKYLPYISNTIDSSEPFIPSIGNRTEWTINTSDISHSGIWTNIYGTHTLVFNNNTTSIKEYNGTKITAVESAKVSSEYGYTLEYDLIPHTLSISDRNYLADIYPIKWMTFDFTCNTITVGNRTGDFINMVANTSKNNSLFADGILKHYIDLKTCDDDCISDTFFTMYFGSLLSTYFVEDRDHNIIISTNSLNGEFPVLSDDSDISNNWVDNTILWEWLFEIGSPLLIPIELNIGEGVRINNSDNVSVKSVIGLLMISMRSNKLGATLVKLNIDGVNKSLIENTSDNKLLIENTIKFWYNHLYFNKKQVQIETNYIDVSSQKINQYRNIDESTNVSQSILNVNDFDICGTRASVIKDQLKKLNINTTNLNLSNSVNLNVPINMDDISVPNINEDWSVLDDYKVELLDFSKQLITKDITEIYETISCDLDEVLYDDQYNLESVSNVKYGDNHLSDNIKFDGTQLYLYENNIDTILKEMQIAKDNKIVGLFRQNSKNLFVQNSEAYSLRRKLYNLDNYLKLLNYEDS